MNDIIIIMIIITITIIIITIIIIIITIIITIIIIIIIITIIIIIIKSSICMYILQLEIASTLTNMADFLSAKKNTVSLKSLENACQGIMGCIGEQVLYSFVIWYFYVTCSPCKIIELCNIGKLFVWRDRPGEGSL